MKNMYVGIYLLLLTLTACGGGGSNTSVNNKKPTDLPITNQEPTVDISSLYTVIKENKTITLVATANDLDGTITSIQWTTNIGSFSAPTELNTSFTAPETSEGDSILITVEVTDNLNSISSASMELSLLKLLTIKGIASYENINVTENGYDYDNIHELPIRGASIYLMDTGNEIVSTSATDENGYYSIEVDGIGPYKLEIVAEIGSSILEDNYISIRDNLTASDERRSAYQTEVYRYNITELDTVTSSLEGVDFKAELLWDRVNNEYIEGRNSPVFSLLDQAYSMQQLIFNWRESFLFSPLTIYWNEHNSISGIWWDGGIASTEFHGHGSNSIHVRSDDEVNIDEFDKTIIGKALGSFALTSLTRDEQIGGGYYFKSAMDMRESFIKGFSTYFSWLLTGSSILIDADGQKNGNTYQQDIFINSDDDYNKGWFYQNVNSDILKTITQGSTEYGLLAQGSDFVFDVLHDHMKASDSFISIHSFIGNTLKLNNSFTTELQNYLLNIGVTSINEWGEGETYTVATHLTKNDSEPTYLPLYTEIQLHEPATVCLNDTIPGSGNRLGVMKYFKLVSDEEGDGYYLNWDSVDGPVYIWSWNATQTPDVAGGGIGTNSPNLIDMSIGTQIIGVSFYGNIFPYSNLKAPPVESGCITISITK